MSIVGGRRGLGGAPDRAIEVADRDRDLKKSDHAIVSRTLKST